MAAFVSLWPCAASQAAGSGSRGEFPAIAAPAGFLSRRGQSEAPRRSIVGACFAQERSLLAWSVGGAATLAIVALQGRRRAAAERWTRAAHVACRTARGSREHRVQCQSQAVAMADGGSPQSQVWRTWADELGIQASKLEVRMLEGAFHTKVRGMCATAEVPHDEALITVPADNVLQVATGEECPLSGKVSAECWRALPWWAQLAVLLVYELKRGKESPLAQWIESLPQDFSSIPLNWSDSELAALDYPPLVENVNKQREELAQAFADAAKGCEFAVGEEDFIWAVQAVRSRAFSGPYEGRKASDRNAQLAFIAALLVGGVASGAVTLENALNGAFVAALSVPLTDFFVGSSARLKRHAVCPVVDYLNHDSKAASDIAYEYFRNEFAVRIRGAFQAGEQVCINYGEKRSNDALLQYYGFVEEDCPHDTYDLELLQHLDEQASTAGERLQVRLSQTGPDEAGLSKLRHLLADDGERGQMKASEMTKPISAENEALVWRAVSVACEAELSRLSQHPASLGDAAPSDGVLAVVERFRAEKRKVLLSCRAHAESRGLRPSSPAPLSFATGSAVLPSFQEAGAWSNTWAEGRFGADHAAELQEKGFTVVPEAFDTALAGRCLEECERLDAASKATVTTNPCNCGSRSLWLEFGEAAHQEMLQRDFPALYELATKLAGLPDCVNKSKALGGGLQVHPAVMVAVYPERAAEYVLHKDSYAPRDNDPATGATRRLTVLAYLNDWRDGDGGELRLHEAAGDQPVPRRFETVAPTAGKIVLFDSPRVWHAVNPALRGSRWAVTLWVH